MQNIASLNGSVKHYDWGGTNYIPSLLQIENPNMIPFAEYWLGVHPQADCTVVLEDDGTVLLRDYINQYPQKMLGEKIYKRFGGMPYLLKVLDVKDMLSIQVHPSKRDAEIEFEKENGKKIPLNATNRNYKDANHKPELMVAMSSFYLLHGFKPEKELIAICEKIKELKLFKSVFKKRNYVGLYKLVMEMPQEEVNELLQPLLNRIIPLYQAGVLKKTDENFWAARAALTFNAPGAIDRGIFSIYFFNLLELKTGDAIFQDAGVPHAYLEGYNVEIMASSDNVLRGGLTSKHIDTTELLKHTKCEATIPNIIKAGKKVSHKIYKAPVNDFALSSYRIKKGDTELIDVTTAEILLLMDGEVKLKSSETIVLLKPGSISCAAFAGAKVKVKAVKDAWLFRAAAR